MKSLTYVRIYFICTHTYIFTKTLGYLFLLQSLITHITMCTAKTHEHFYVSGLCPVVTHTHTCGGAYTRMYAPPRVWEPNGAWVPSAGASGGPRDNVRPLWLWGPRGSYRRPLWSPGGSRGTSLFWRLGGLGPRQGPRRVSMKWPCWRHLRRIIVNYIWNNIIYYYLEDAEGRWGRENIIYNISCYILYVTSLRSFTAGQGNIYYTIYNIV